MKIYRELKKKFRNKKSIDPSELIEQFKNEVLTILNDNLKGLYIIGSYGLNDFNQDLSDIDFVITLNENLSQDEINQIRKMHLGIEKKVLQPNLNGIYMLENDLGKEKESIATLISFHEGELNTFHDKQRFYEINPITWAELQFNAITVYGKESKLTTDWNKVNDFLYQNINSYWTNWLNESKNPLHPYYYATLLRKSENAWCVSGVARLWYTLKEQQITSKRKACEYLINKVPSKFENIIEDTINFRSGKKARPAWKQKKETLEFLEYCINNFNLEYQKTHN